jgi:hypothetical protein
MPNQKNQMNHSLDGLYIGVDPDLARSGVAIWDSKYKILTLKTLSFWQLFDLLSEHRDRIILVKVEAGWLNLKSNWHSRYGQTKAAGESIAKNVGENHATGKLICQMCVYLELHYNEVRPRNHKLNAKIFRAIAKYKRRTNQEERDAGALLFEFMNL